MGDRGESPPLKADKYLCERGNREQGRRQHRQPGINTFSCHWSMCLHHVICMYLRCLLSTVSFYHFCFILTANCETSWVQTKSSQCACSNWFWCQAVLQTIKSNLCFQHIAATITEKKAQFLVKPETFLMLTRFFFVMTRCFSCYCDIFFHHCVITNYLCSYKIFLLLFPATCTLTPGIYRSIMQHVKDSYMIPCLHRLFKQW